MLMLTWLLVVLLVPESSIANLRLYDRGLLRFSVVCCDWMCWFYLLQVFTLHGVFCFEWMEFFVQCWLSLSCLGLSSLVLVSILPSKMSSMTDVVICVTTAYHLCQLCIGCNLTGTMVCGFSLWDHQCDSRTNLSSVSWEASLLCLLQWLWCYRSCTSSTSQDFLSSGIWMQILNY